MSSVTEPTNAKATRREPILICYDDSPAAVRAIEAAAALLNLRVPADVNRVLAHGRVEDDPVGLAVAGGAAQVPDRCQLDLTAATAAAQAREHRGNVSRGHVGAIDCVELLTRTPPLPELELDGLPRPAVVEL